MSIQQRRPQRRDQQPPDQRMLMFLLFAVSLLMLYQGVFVRPPVVDPKAEQAAAEAGADAVDGKALVAPPDAESEPEIPAPSEQLVEAEAPADAELLTLGSVDDQSPYRMLLTVNNAGAGVERVSLSSDHYRDLDNRSGYLGHLAPTDADGGGAQVNLVGEGSPAAQAGLRVGDVITALAVGEQSADIDDARALLLALDAAKPKQKVTIRATRDGESVELSARLGRHPLDLLRPEIENVRLHTPNPPSDYESAMSFLVRIASLNGRRATDDADPDEAGDPQLDEANRRLTEEPWTIEARDEQSVALHLRLADLGLEFAKRYTLVPTPEGEKDNGAYPSYHFDVSVEVRNLSGEEQTVAYELTGPNGLPIEGFWYANKIGRGDGSFFGDWGSFGLRDVVVRFAGDRLTQFAATEVAKGKVPPMGKGRPLAFAGVDAQYFSSFVMPKKEQLTDVWLSEVRAATPTEHVGADSYYDRWQNSSVVLARQPVKLAAAGEDGSRLDDEYRVFAGPKLPELLEAYSAAEDADHTLDGILYYGWFGWAAKPMLWLLHGFHAIVGNYGVAIILLTLCVRLAMFPISRQSALNMVKMQQLKPELDRIADRYKEDMQKRAQAQQELFRKHNYNPAAGCLPIFLQLPIFMGLYRALAVDVELRQEPLFSDAIRFCGNLAAPDQFVDWSSITPLWMDNGQGILGFGPYFNLLPLLTCVLFLLQQKMFMPPPANEQAALQQKMMKYMMLFMGLMFFKVPSGLCIYFIVSSLWGIAERKMLPRPTPVTPAPVESPALKKSPPSANGSAAKAKLAAKKQKARGKKKR